MVALRADQRADDRMTTCSPIGPDHCGNGLSQWRITLQIGFQPAMQGFGWTPASAFGNNLLMNIGKRLRELRQAKNLSQGDLERLAGLHRSYISRVEGGHSVPALHTLERFAAALDGRYGIALAQSSRERCLMSVR